VDADLRLENPEIAQLIAMLEERGHVEAYVDEQGREVYRLTEEGVRLGEMLAMVEDEDAAAALARLVVDRSGPPLVADPNDGIRDDAG
jgi:hypothetical protein